MSYYTSPGRIFDVNSNKRKESKNYFNFENAYTPSTASNHHNHYHDHNNHNNNNSDYNHNNSNKTHIDDHDDDNNHHHPHHHHNNNNNDSDSRYYSSPVHDNTHNTSGYSSGFDDASYGSNDTLDDHHQPHHLHPPPHHHHHQQQEEQHHESTHDVEYSRAPDTFPCGHVLCHNCVRKFMRMRQRSGYSCCPVCHTPIYEDISLHAMGLAVNSPSPLSPPSTPSCIGSPPSWSRPTSPLPTSPSVFSPPPTPSPSPSDPTPISLLTNFDEMVKKFTGFDNGYYGLRRLKDESVKSKSMGMTFTNTQCHLCMENHGTLRVVQEYNQLSVKHERPNLWSNYFYRLQHGKVVTEFHSKVNSSCICVPCTYKELQQRNLPQLKALPRVDPSTDTRICLAEVGKILAKNSAPIMALQGKNVIEIEHTLQLRQRADHFDFRDTADQVERMVKQQEETLLNIATKQIRDTGRLYHVKETNNVEYDLDETAV